MLDMLLDLHWMVLLKIILIDIMLGVDNAIVIAMAVASLDVSKQNKAIMFGTAGAILFRIALLFVGFILVGIPFVKLFAGGYLVYLAFNMLKGEDGHKDVGTSSSMWGAVWTIVIADLMMSLDNVVALVGAADGTGDHAVWYTIFGIVLSIPIIIFASKFLVKLLEKFPALINLGAGLIAWVGVEMMMKEDFAKIGEILSNHTINIVIASLLTAFIIFLNPIKGIIEKYKNRKQQVA